MTAADEPRTAPRSRRRRGGRGGRRRRFRRPLPPLSVMPTLVTLGNLVAGFLAIQYAAKPLDASGPWGWSTLTVAGTLVFIGMFLDAVDGSVARLTRTQSEIGAQLDSLSDLVTFGVAPAFMMLRLVTHYLGPDSETTILGPEAEIAVAKVVWGVAVIYVCCAALRLARFNVETPSAAVEDHLVFRGLPSPGAAGAVASLILVHQHWLYTSPMNADEVSVAFARWTAFGLPLVTLLCAVGMVSSMPYLHVMNRYVGGRRSFAYVARLVIPLILLLVWFHQETLAIAFTLYAVMSPLRRTLSRMRRRKAAHAVPPAAPSA